MCTNSKSIDNITDERVVHLELTRLKMGALGRRKGAILFDCIDCIIPYINDSDLSYLSYKRADFKARGAAWPATQAPPASRCPGCLETHLKNNAPTPGIGIRRKLHKHIKTITIQEQKYL
eukprot:363349-Chlamydomonas_euryale.AAC.7